MSGWLAGLLDAMGINVPPQGLLDAPVGTSTMQRMTNASPYVSPVATPAFMTSEQKIGRFWNAATGRAKQHYTAADLPQLSAAGNEALDAGMGWATTTPIRAYHASPNAFERFDIRKAGSTTDAGDLGRGLYFTTDNTTAVSPPFAGPGTKMPHRYEVDLAVSNPLPLEMPSFSADKAKLIREKIGLPANATAQEVAEKVQSMGHDAAVLDYAPTGYKAKEIAVYDDKLIDILRRYGLLPLLGGGFGATGVAPDHFPDVGKMVGAAAVGADQ